MLLISARIILRDKRRRAFCAWQRLRFAAPPATPVAACLIIRRCASDAALRALLLLRRACLRLRHYALYFIAYDVTPPWRFAMSRSASTACAAAPARRCLPLRRQRLRPCRRLIDCAAFMRAQRGVVAAMLLFLLCARLCEKRFARQCAQRCALRLYNPPFPPPPSPASLPLPTLLCLLPSLLPSSSSSSSLPPPSFI